MANIKLRSPVLIYRQATANPSTAAYAIIVVQIEGVTRYTIRKNVDSSYYVLYDISEISRDYLSITYDGTYPTGTNSQYIDITWTITFYDSNDNTVGSTITDSPDGFDAYSEFSEGVNQTMAAHSLAQSNTTMFVPDNTAGVIPNFGSAGGGIIYTAFSTTDTSKTISGGGSSITITIKRICEPKYTPIKVTFVNKYGALQDLFFDKKNQETINISRDTFNGNILSSTATYSTTEHSKNVFNVIGNESITMNTGFLPESMNEVFKELLLSEQCWGTISGTIYPLTVKDSSLTFKTSVNDKLVNFTVQFDYAFDLINNIR